MADYDDIQSQIDALKALVSSRKGAVRPKKVAVAEPEDNEVVYEDTAPRRAPKPTAPKKTAPAPKSIDLRVSRPEPRVPVRATVPAHRCNCPDCPHKN